MSDLDTDRERALASLWQCLADSAVEHDAEHQHRALALLRELMQREAAE